MQTEIPFILFCILIHASLYLSSDRADRRLRLVAGMVVLLATGPAWYGGVQLAGAQDALRHWLGVILRMAPYYLPLVSFAVYWRRRNFS